MRTGAGVVATRDGELGLRSAFPWEDVKCASHASSVLPTVLL